MKTQNKKGFTLAELLIVVAIIAVLVAIAIPVFTNQLEKSRETTDAANIRAAYAELMVAAIGDGSAETTKTVTLKQQDAGWKNNELLTGLTLLFNADNDAATELAKVDKGKTATLTWNAGTATADGYVSIAVA